MYIKTVFNFCIVMKNENISYLVKNYPPQKTLISLGEENKSKKSSDNLLKDSAYFFLNTNPRIIIITPITMNNKPICIISSPPAPLPLDAPGIENNAAINIPKIKNPIPPPINDFQSFQYAIFTPHYTKNHTSHINIFGFQNKKPSDYLHIIRIFSQILNEYMINLCIEQKSRIELHQKRKERLSQHVSECHINLDYRLWGRRIPTKKVFRQLLSRKLNLLIGFSSISQSDCNHIRLLGVPYF